MTALQKDGSDLVHQGGALADELVAHPVQGLHVELRFRLQRDEPHGRTGRSLCDRLGIAVVVLLCLDVGPHVFRRHQPDGVALSGERPAHVMRATARLRGDDAGRKRRAKGHHRLAPHPASQDDPTGRILPDKAAAVFAQIDPEYRNGHRSAPSLV